jgi:hypothetical protein
MSTDIKSSSSDGGKVMMLGERNDRHPLFDDQINSENNIQELEPSPNLLAELKNRAVILETCKYSKFPHEILLAFRRISLVVVLLLSTYIEAGYTQAFPSD